MSELTPARAGVLISEAVSALERRGELDEPFFAALVEARPKKANRILDVARLFGCASGERRTKRAPSKRRRDHPERAAEGSTTINVNNSRVSGPIAGRDVVIVQTGPNTDELVGLLESRARGVVAELDAHPVSAPLAAQFQELHRRNIQGLRAGRLVVAHETTMEIRDLLERAKKVLGRDRDRSGLRYLHGGRGQGLEYELADFLSSFADSRVQAAIRAAEAYLSVLESLEFSSGR